MRVYVVSHFSHVQLFVTPWTVARQAHLSMGFSRQEYWSGWPCPPPGDLPDAGIKPVSSLLHWQAGSLSLVPPWKPELPLLPLKPSLSSPDSASDPSQKQGKRERNAWWNKGILLEAL